MTKPKLLSLNTKHNRKVRIRDIVFHLGVVHLLLTQVGLLIIVENKLFLSDPTLYRRVILPLYIVLFNFHKNCYSMVIIIYRKYTNWHRPSSRRDILCLMLIYYRIWNELCRKIKTIKGKRFNYMSVSKEVFVMFLFLESLNIDGWWLICHPKLLKNL